MFSLMLVLVLSSLPVLAWLLYHCYSSNTPVPCLYPTNADAKTFTCNMDSAFRGSYLALTRVGSARSGVSSRSSCVCPLYDIEVYNVFIQSISARNALGRNEYKLAIPVFDNTKIV